MWSCVFYKRATMGEGSHFFPRWLMYWSLKYQKDKCKNSSASEKRFISADDIPTGTVCHVTTEDCKFQTGCRPATFFPTSCSIIFKSFWTFCGILLFFRKMFFSQIFGHISGIDAALWMTIPASANCSSISVNRLENGLFSFKSVRVHIAVDRITSNTVTRNTI